MASKNLEMYRIFVLSSTPSLRWHGPLVTEHHRARANLEKVFEEIKRLRDQLHDENVVLREQIDKAFMFERSLAPRRRCRECFPG
jgi:hypothetical protein